MAVSKFLFRRTVFFISCFLVTADFSNAQSLKADSIKFNHQKIFADALDGNIREVLNLINSDTSMLSIRDRKLKAAFESRFKFTEDKSVYPDKISPIDGLLKIYKNYWRISLLDNTNSYDSILIRNLSAYLATNYEPAKTLAHSSNEDTLNYYLIKYISSLHLYTTGFGKTGKLLDLLVWKTQKDTVYCFSLPHEKIKAPVTFMDDFITLGWEEYATLGELYPGGWTTDKSLFCVKSAYDLSSENFLISYLAHEGRHFKDKELFPDLSGADLEYRAKLTELAMAKNTLYDLIEFFINNSNHESENAHELANYCVIRDLSKILFHKEFENDIAQWKKLDAEIINKTALKVLETNTSSLKKQGKSISHFIK